MTSHAANRRGIIALLTASASFTINDAMVKLVTRHFPVGEIIFVRSVMAMVCFAVALAAMGQFGSIKKLARRSIVSRSIFDAAATGFFVVALAHMNLANLISVSMTSPLIMTALAVFLYKEDVGWRRWSAIMVGLLGVLFIVKPLPGSFDVWALLGLGAALSSATRDLITRQLDVAVPALAVGFAASIAVTLCGALIGVSAGETWRMMGGEDLALIAGATVFLAVGSYLIVLAFRAVDVSVVAPFRYSVLFWGIIAGYLILGELPDKWGIFGAALIAASGLYTLHRETVRQRRITTTATPPQ